MSPLYPVMWSLGQSGRFYSRSSSSSISVLVLRVAMMKSTAAGTMPEIAAPDEAVSSRSKCLHPRLGASDLPLVPTRLLSLERREEQSKTRPSFWLGTPSRGGVGHILPNQS